MTVILSLNQNEANEVQDEYDWDYNMSQTINFRCFYFKIIVLLLLCLADYYMCGIFKLIQP